MAKTQETTARQDRIHKRIVEQLAELPVPQTTVENSEAFQTVSQERSQERIWDQLSPQIMENIALALHPAPPDRIPRPNRGAD